jgi:hypothetical protein
MTKARKIKTAHHQALLTDDVVAALPFAKTGRGYIVRDTKLVGLQCVIGRKSKRIVFTTEYAEPGGKRTVIYRRLGTPEHITEKEWRARAFEEKARISRMTGPPDARAGVTLMQTWGPAIDGEPAPGGYLSRLHRKQRSVRTIADYWQKLQAHLPHDKALKDITRGDVVRLHARLTADVGSYAANGCVRLGHALFRHAQVRMEVPGLGANPFSGHDLNPETPRQTGMAETDLKEWFEQVMQLDNAIQREVWMAFLFTGLRRRDVTTMRWQHVAQDHIVIPSPKGGSKNASRIPVTPALRRVLDRVKKAGKTYPPHCADWVFPSTTSASGHIEETKNQALDRSPHSLRHTFRGMYEGAKVSRIHGKLLMLHKVDADVHDSYMTVPSMFAQLSAAAGEVAAYIVLHLPKDAERRLLAALRAPRAA